MRYTLIPPNDDNSQLTILVGGGTTVVRKDKPIFCETEDELVYWAGLAPYLRIVELGMTCAEMVSKGNAQIAAEDSAPETGGFPVSGDIDAPAIKVTLDGFECPTCKRVCKTAYTLKKHMESHKGGEE